MMSRTTLRSSGTGGGRQVLLYLYETLQDQVLLQFPLAVLAARVKEKEKTGRYLHQKMLVSYELESSGNTLGQ